MTDIDEMKICINTTRLNRARQFLYFLKKNKMAEVIHTLLTQKLKLETPFNRNNQYIMF